MNSFDVFGHDSAVRLTLTLLHFVWQGIGVAVAVAVAAWCLRRASANLRYGVNVAALVLMAVCFPVTFGLVSVPPGSRVPKIAEPPEVAAAEPAMAASVSPGGPRGGLPLEGEIWASPSAHDGLVALPAARSSSVASPDGTPRNLLTALQSAAPFATGAYLSGLAIMLLRLWAALWGGRRLRLASTPVTDADWLAMVARQARRLGLKAAPAIAHCAQISVPVVVGIAKPLVLLPASLATGLTPNQLESLLAHELAHIRRYDLAVNLLQRLIETVLFFHPAVWYVSRRVSREREVACDDLVLSAGWPRVQYADALVRMAELCSQGLSARSRGQDGPATLVAASGKSPSQFQQRILRVLQPDIAPGLRLTTGSLVLTVVLVAGAVLCPSLIQSWANPLGSDDTPSSQPAAGETAPPRVAPAGRQDQQSGAASSTDVAVSTVAGEGKPPTNRATSETSVQAALARAARFIESQRTSDGGWQSGPTVGAYKDGVTALCTLALLRAGRTPDDAAVKEPLERLQQVRPAYTYTVALHTVALCAADSTKHRDVIKRNIAWLAETQTEDDAARGGWSYGPQRLTRSDGSNTRFAVWALDEASRAGVPAPDTTWRAAADYWLHSQKDDGSWGYVPQFSAGTVTMTLAGIASLAAARRSTADTALQRDIDAAVARAWKWHDAKFSAEQLGQSSSWQFYALQALGLAASLTEHWRIGDSAWRDQATPLLLKLQDARDGSWQGKPAESPLIATSMAILFLTSSPAKDTSTSRRAPPREQPDLVWGPPTKGLQAAVEFVPQQESYAFGNVLGVRFHVRNVSDRTIRFSSELARQGDHPTVLNKAGHEQRVSGVENTNWPQLFPFTIKPGQEAVLDAYPLGIYETEEQGRRFKHTAGNYLVCAPGHYTIRYTVNLGNVVQKDATGKQIWPAEGDWVGTIETGLVPLVVGRQAGSGLPGLGVNGEEAKTVMKESDTLTPEQVVQQQPKGKVTVKFRVASVGLHGWSDQQLNEFLQGTMPGFDHGGDPPIRLESSAMLPDGGKFCVLLASHAMRRAAKDVQYLAAKEDQESQCPYRLIKPLRSHFTGKTIRATGELDHTKVPRAVREDGTVEGPMSDEYVLRVDSPDGFRISLP